MEEGRLSSIRWVSVFLLDEKGMEEFRRKVGSDWSPKDQGKRKSEVCMHVLPTFGLRKTQKVTIIVHCGVKKWGWSEGSSLSPKSMKNNQYCSIFGGRVCHSHVLRLELLCQPGSSESRVLYQFSGREKCTRV